MFINKKKKSTFYKPKYINQYISLIKFFLKKILNNKFFFF